MAAVGIQIIGLDKLLAGFRRAPQTTMSEAPRAVWPRVIQAACKAASTIASPVRVRT
jgi:hypothetical protein